MLLASDPNQMPERGRLPRCRRRGRRAMRPRRRAGRRARGALGERFETVKGAPAASTIAGARYQIRAFVRLKPEGACPARTIWSDYSEPFVIAPWYEGAGAPPVQMPLPDATDRKLLRALKPNVAFVVPPALQQPARRAVRDDLAEGKAAIAQPDLQLDLQLQHPDHHDLRLHRPEHLPVAVRPDLPLDVLHQDLHPVPEDRRRKRRMKLTWPPPASADRLAAAAAARRHTASCA